MRRPRPRPTVALLAALLAGCGSAPGPPSAAASSAARAAASSAARAAAAATLPAGAVPYLPSLRRALTATDLAREAGVPALSERLRAWGYLAGAQRYFQGESTLLQVVDSRALRFRSPTGAAAFVAFIRTHLEPYLGSVGKLGSVSAGGRHGMLAAAQECACHLASPAYLALFAGGRTVTWLQIDGPGATPRRLRLLAARVL